MNAATNQPPVLPNRLGQLSWAGQRLVSSFDEKVIVARLGGDEFAVLSIVHSCESNVRKFARQLETVFDKPVIVGDHELAVAASIGVVFSRDVDGGVEHVRSVADKSMYKAKTVAGTSCEIFEPNKKRRENAAQNKFEIVRALENQEIALFFQPKIELKSNTVIGFEALARWQHPVRGLLHPGDFLPDIAELGLEVDFDVAMVSRALEFVEECRNFTPSDFQIAVNLSENTLSSQRGRKTLLQLFESDRQAAEMLTIEMTENVFTTRAADGIRRSIDVFKSLGLRVSMDDFGTGYGSFRHLKEFDFDELKIDRQFISGIGCDASSEVIINAFVELARGLHSDVVAEGIETEDQLSYLKKIGCKFGQGYLFGKAVKADDAIVLVKKQSASTKSVA